MSTVSDDRLFTLFRELQARGLIDGKRRLLASPVTPNMQGMARSIRYRKAFYEQKLAHLSDDALRFVLLHEEGHIREGSLATYGIAALPLLLLIGLAGSPLTAVPDAAISAISALLVAGAALLCYRIFYRRMYEEEFVADRYAAEILQRHYNIGHPSRLLQSILTGIADTGGSISPSYGRQFSGYFPPIEERVTRIRAGVDAA